MTPKENVAQIMRECADRLPEGTVFGAMLTITDDNRISLLAMGGENIETAVALCARTAQLMTQDLQNSDKL